jgi:hypothetical protein
LKNVTLLEVPMSAHLARSWVDEGRIGQMLFVNMNTKASQMAHSITRDHSRHTMSHRRS